MELEAKITNLLKKLIITNIIVIGVSAIINIDIAFIIGIFIIPFDIIFVIASIVKMGGKYKNELKQNSKLKRFRYNDTFFYSNNDKNISSASAVFHILEDVETNKLYGFSVNMTNIGISMVLNKVSTFRVEGLTKKAIEIYDEGNMWINKEFDGKSPYHIPSDKEKHLFKNINPLNNESILDKVTFVYGIAELDKKQ